MEEHERYNEGEIEHNSMCLCEIVEPDALVNAMEERLRHVARHSRQYCGNERIKVYAYITLTVRQ